MALDGAQGWTVCTAHTYLWLRRWVAPKPSPNSIVPAESARKWDPFLIHLFKGGGGYLFLLILLRHQNLVAGAEDSLSLFYLE